MAQRVDIVLVDDINGDCADETVSFALDGVEYEIDLSDRNAATLRDTLTMYIGSARKIPTRRRSRRRTAG